MGRRPALDASATSDQGPPGILVGDGVNEVDHDRRLVFGAAGGSDLIESRQSVAGRPVAPAHDHVDGFRG